MLATVTRPSNTGALITKVAHGLTLPGTDKLMAIYIEPTTGNLLPSDSTDANKQKAVFVTDIIDLDNIRVQTTGFWRSVAHGYTVGEYYYVTDAGDGGFSTTPGTLNDVSFLVFDVNTLLLIDNREL
tara:strand:+ start:6206 stop:6586 length:381 start_codon:yes stop_codon:yes gene_type:complete